MVKIKDIIIKLKEVREEKNLSFNDIIEMMEKNGDYISKSTLSRVFADGSEDQGFRYEITIRPIAKALLDIENIEDDDTMDVQAMKTILKYKSDRISELENHIKELETALDKQKIRANEKLEHERDQAQKSIEFLKEQIAYKDKRMDLLLASVQEKDILHKEMLEKILRCAKCEKYEN